MSDDNLVYSTESGKGPRDLPATGSKSKPPGRGGGKGKGAPRKNVAAIPNDGVVRIFREKGPRGGKTVTVVRGLPANQVETLTPKLKKLCGAGGTHREGAIEIQGDQRERIAKHLEAAGYTVKLAGG